MRTVGDRFPDFELKAVVSTDADEAFTVLDQDSHAGSWKVYFFYPKDFTFVCPTELSGFARLNERFQERGVQLLAGSTDNEYVHLAWRRDHPDLAALPYPMLSDIKRELSTALGILDSEEGVCLRATFVVDPEGVIRHASVNDGSVGRNPEEILRIVEALQTGELCPCNWQTGECTLQVA